jgi:hypothetical protein
MEIVIFGTFSKHFTIGIKNFNQILYKTNYNFGYKVFIFSFSRLRKNTKYIFIFARRFVKEKIIEKLIRFYNYYSKKFDSTLTLVRNKPLVKKPESQNNNFNISSIGYLPNHPIFVTLKRSYEYLSFYNHETFSFIFLKELLARFNFLLPAITRQNGILFDYTVYFLFNPSSYSGLYNYDLVSKFNNFIIEAKFDYFFKPILNQLWQNN